MASATTLQRIQTTCLLTIALIAVGASLQWLRPVLTPFVVAVSFSFLLGPVVDLLQRRARLPAPIAILGTVLLAVGLLLAVGALVTMAVGQMVAGLEAYQSNVRLLIERVEQQLIELGVDPSDHYDPLKQKIPSYLGSVVTGAMNAVLNLLSSGVLVLIFTVFLIAGRSTPSERRSVEWLDQVQSKIKTYLTVKVLISGATGVLVFVILRLLGIDFAMAFGLFAFLLNFIPSIGSIVAVALPVPVVLVSPEVSTTSALLAIALPGLVQIVMGNVLEPRLMGQSLDLHPVTILMALIFWGILWGFLGMVLSVPMTAVMKIFFERIDYTRPIADLMAGKLPET